MDDEDPTMELPLSYDLLCLFWSLCRISLCSIHREIRSLDLWLDFYPHRRLDHLCSEDTSRFHRLWCLYHGSLLGTHHALFGVLLLSGQSCHLAIRLVGIETDGDATQMKKDECSLYRNLRRKLVTLQ